jgi:peptidyl-prolyl cis-trans isomerase C
MPTVNREFLLTNHPHCLSMSNLKLLLPFSRVLCTSSVVVACVIASPVWAQNIAIVNGKPVPSARVQIMERQMAASGQPVTEQVLDQIRDEVINREVLLQAATALGLNTTQTYQDQMSLARESILIRALLADFEAKNPITDAMVAAEYKRIAESDMAQEHRASHILVETLAQANDVVEELAKGGDFATLAKKLSKDPGSGAQGGDLGWANASGYVPEFGAAMVALQVNETSKPVQTQFGFHVIRLIETRKRDLPPLEQVRDQVADQLKTTRLNTFQNELRAKATIQ